MVGASVQPGSVESRCKRVRRIDKVSGLCEGCLRTLPEIARWSSMPDDEKRAVITSLPARSFVRQQEGWANV